jgi:hypothetical protein
MACSLGSYCPDTFSSNSCSDGMWCPAGSISPTPCPAGFSCPNPSTKIQCPPNQYCLQGETAGTNCSAATCSIGMYVSSVCSATSDTQCSPCTYLPVNAAYVASTVSICPWMCDPGYLLDRGLCIECPVNSWCIQGAIILCPDNTSSPVLSSSPNQCLCVPGWGVLL